MTNPTSGDDAARVEPDFQERVDQWVRACFGSVIRADMIERADRFVEESLELAQTVDGFGAPRAHALVDYVFGRQVGERKQEVGGVMVTLAALCNASFGVHMEREAETELARIWTKVDAIRAKQAAKPTGSALPIAAMPMATPHDLLAGTTEAQSELIDAIISAYHTTRLRYAPVAQHILSKPRVQAKFEALLVPDMAEELAQLRREKQNNECKIALLKQDIVNERDPEWRARFDEIAGASRNRLWDACAAKDTEIASLREALRLAQIAVCNAQCTHMPEHSYECRSASAALARAKVAS